MWKINGCVYLRSYCNLSCNSRNGFGKGKQESRDSTLLGNGCSKENPKASIERLAGMGYKAFELVQWGGDTKVFGLPAEEFKALCDQNGVKIISTHSSIQEDTAKEDEIMQRWRQLLRFRKHVVANILLSLVTMWTTP